MGLPARPLLVELALVRVEQNQRVEHLRRLMRPLARDPRELVTLVLLQSHHVTLHANLLAVVGRREGYHETCDISRVT